MKCAIIREDDTYDLQRAINTFIKDKEVVNISHSSVPSSFNKQYTVIIIYKEEV